MNFHALVSSAHQRTKRTGRNKRKWISSDGCDQQSIVATFEIARFVAESKQWRASDAWKRKKISQRQHKMTREYLTCTFVMHKLPQIDLLSCNLMILFDSILYFLIINMFITIIHIIASPTSSCTYNYSLQRHINILVIF